LDVMKQELSSIDESKENADNPWQFKQLFLKFAATK
jgi:hypothetical protein